MFQRILYEPTKPHFLVLDGMKLVAAAVSAAQDARHAIATQRPVARIYSAIGKVDVRNSYKDEFHFGAVSLRRVDNMDYGYSFPDKTIGQNALEIHLYGLRSVNSASDVLANLGQAARYISSDEKLSSSDHVVGVTFPELIASAVRLGMRQTPVTIIKEDFKEDISYYQDIFYLLNGKQREKQCIPAAAYLPTDEFVERFSRFAPVPT